MPGEPAGEWALEPHGPTVPQAPAASSAVDGLGWRRFHPVTPVIKGWKVLLVLLVILAQQTADNVGAAQDVVRDVGWGPVFAVLGAVLLIATAYAAIAWRMTRYAIGPDAVYLRSGVLFRRQRTARLDRIQAIDVVQPLLARIIGLAELKIEVAGGADSAVKLSFLREQAAQDLRNELLARAAGVVVDVAGAGPAGAPAIAAIPAAPEREVFAVTAPRLLGSLVRSIGVLVSVLLVVALVVAVVWTGEIGPAFGLLPALLGAAGFVWQRFAGEFNFRAALSPDGIRLRHGLLEARAQTVPPGRVQAVRITQGPLWRGKDWWRVEMNVAGYGVAQNQQTESVLLPVGERFEALLALWLVLPDLGTDDPQTLLDAGLSGSGEGLGFVTDPRRARWLNPWTWRRNGVATTDRAVLLRGGRFVRRLVIVPHERTQSLGISQGPLQRRLRLASFALHSTPGPISPVMPHLDQAVAGVLLLEQATRARTARARSGPERWMTAQAEAAQPQAAQRQVVEPPVAYPPPPGSYPPPAVAYPPPPPGGEPE
jgi:putative membrane protein